MQVKICGITRPEELATLSTLSVDLVGLWHGVRDGHADLDLSSFCRLVRTARERGGPDPVMVTFLKDPDSIGNAIFMSGVRWVQLHGYQSPGLVARIRERFGRAVTLVKVLHVQGKQCLERGLIGAYEKAGIDIFLLDTATTDGRVGSTGQQLNAQTALTIADQSSRPFLLAGGISAFNHVDYRLNVEHPNFFGIDVDSNARNERMDLCAEAVSAVRQSWRSCFHEVRANVANIH